jgi:broad specificity phosphatase PhoE
MLRRTIAMLALALSPLAMAQPPSPTHVTGPRLEGEPLLDALRAGGYTLYFRHAARDRTQSLPPEKSDCLVESGKAQARAIGEAMKALRIPIGESIASPMCRTMETAELIAGRAKAESAVRDEKDGGLDGYFTRLKQLMLAPPAAGTNRLVSGHVSAWNTLLQGERVLLEGEAAVLRSEGGKFVLAARLRAEDWKTYADPANRHVLAERSSLPDPPFALADGALADALRSGGYTVYFRHGATDHTQKDLAPFDAADCTKQRNLADAGREELRAIHAAIAKLTLPVGEVIASPYCRTMETARLVTGKEPTPHDALRGMSVAAKGKFDFRDLREMFTVPVEAGTLRFIIGHGNGLMETVGLPEPMEGEATVLRATPGGWIVVGRLRAGQWPGLMKSAGL